MQTCELRWCDHVVRLSWENTYRCMADIKITDKTLGLLSKPSEYVLDQGFLFSKYLTDCCTDHCECSLGKYRDVMLSLIDLIWFSSSVSSFSVWSGNGWKTLPVWTVGTQAWNSKIGSNQQIWIKWGHSQTIIIILKTTALSAILMNAADTFSGFWTSPRALWRQGWCTVTVMVIFNTAKKKYIKSQNLGFGLALIVKFCMCQSSVFFFSNEGLLRRSTRKWLTSDNDSQRRRRRRRMALAVCPFWMG